MKKYIDNVLLGADPEVFLLDQKTNKYVSSIGLIGGSKENPRDLGNGIFVQEDNVLAEFNIPPAKTLEEFKGSITRGVKEIELLLPKGVVVDIKPYAFFGEDQLRHEKALEFGCTPDFNCWTLEQNISPTAKDQTLRTGAGHIHFSWDNPELPISRELGRALDLYTAVPATLISDEGPRKELYGKMGCVRFKAYGLEYRTLSNFWLKTEALIEWAYQASMEAIAFVNGGKKIDEITEAIMAMAINESNREAAEFLVDEFKLKLA